MKNGKTLRNIKSSVRFIVIFSLLFDKACVEVKNWGLMLAQDEKVTEIDPRRTMKQILYEIV